MSESCPFIQDLAGALSANPLREKVLLAPSLRVARQWLDRAAALAGGILNARGATLRGLLLDYAEPVMVQRGLRIASREEKIRLVGETLAHIGGTSADGTGYFSRLTPSVSLAEAMLRTLEEMEDGDVTGEALRALPGSREKREELATLGARFRTACISAGFAGRGDITAAALSALASRQPLPLVLLPDSVAELADAGEKRVLRRWPAECLHRLAEKPARPSASLRFFRSDVPANEAREIFRTIHREGLALDQVEVVCVDESGYADHTLLAAWETFGGEPESLPLTFHGGLPAWRSRPARLLAAWLGWLENDLPPEGLARLLESGLAGEAWRHDAPALAAPRLASRLRSLPINGRPGDYRRHLGQERGENDSLYHGELWLARWLPTILPLAGNGERLDRNNGVALLEAALAILDAGADGDGKLDAYARRALREAIAAWLPHADWDGFNALAWLASLAASLRVMGLGPQPGRVHVSDLASGGHSGRPCTFLVGLDDGRFPGGSRQDPVLLDNERRRLSRSLALSRTWRERRERAMERLLGRLRGKVFLSHAAHDGRDLFPSLLYSRLRQGGEEASPTLRPDALEACCCARDGWLHSLLPHGVASPGQLAPRLPHLARGVRADAERLSPHFTAWDGYVPEAGEDFLRERWPLSPTHLEELATCPLEFFFKRVLRIRPPDRYQPLPGRWLPGNERGNLLHDLFQDFLGGLMAEGRAVDGTSLAADRDILLDMLETALRRYRRQRPPHDDLAYERERGELIEACAIFLAGEALRQSRGRPLCLEAALGGAREDLPPWNFQMPVELSLPSGITLHLQGRVDRIDRLHDHGGLVIWDYKTGLSSGFSRSDPFRQGRHLQPYLYGEMVAATMRRQGRPEPVHCFSYVFPMPRDEGRTFAYPWAELRDGGSAVVTHLAAMLAAGAFPFTTEAGDVARFSDYLPLYGDASALAAAAKGKVAAAGPDSPLAAWARLRGLAGDGEKEEEA